MTAPLCDVAHDVVAVELDNRFAEVLSSVAPRARVIQQDVLKTDLLALLREMPEPRCIVSNMPYNITGPLLGKVTECSGLIRNAVLMMQKEVGERVLAPAGSSERGSLSVAMQLQFSIEKVCDAKAGAFLPSPRVDSIVLDLTPLETKCDLEKVARCGAHRLYAAAQDPLEQPLIALRQAEDRPCGENPSPPTDERRVGGTRRTPMNDQIRKKAIDLGFDSVGFCSADPPETLKQFDKWIEKGRHGTMAYLARNRQLRADPRGMLPEAKSVVAVTMNYNQPNPHAPGMPHIARYALGRDYHKVVRQRLRKLAAFIEATHVGAKTRVCVDSAPVLEREYANRAGLGWYGKNTMLIDSKRGSWFFIGIILTSLELQPDKRAVGGCGTCTACIDACPTGAIIMDDDRWQVNATRCISYLTIEHKGDISPELEGKIGTGTFGCDVCQEVCPFNGPRATSRTLRKNDNRP